MHPSAMAMAAILVHSLYRFSLCTKMAIVAVAKLLLCYDIIMQTLHWEGPVSIEYPDIWQYRMQ